MKARAPKLRLRIPADRNVTTRPRGRDGVDPSQDQAGDHVLKHGSPSPPTARVRRGRELTPRSGFSSGWCPDFQCRSSSPKCARWVAQVGQWRNRPSPRPRTDRPSRRSPAAPSRPRSALTRPYLVALSSFRLASFDPGPRGHQVPGTSVEHTGLVDVGTNLCPTSCSVYPHSSGAGVVVVLEVHRRRRAARCRSNSSPCAGW